MDSSEGECSATIPAKEKEEIPENTETTTRFDEFNGSCFTEIGDLGSGEHVEVKTSTETNGNEIGLEKLLETPSKTNESPSAVSGGTTPTTKGYGLKKWRRIRRGFTKEGGNSVDFNRILKRGLTNAAEPTRPPRELSVEIKQKSEGSVASANSSAKSPSAPSVSAVKSLTSESRLAAGSAFPFCSDSENSEDRSSKSSTAASAPKLRYDAPSLVMASTREKGKVKNPSGKNSGNAVQRGHHGTGRIETSKKLRGEKIKVETANSYSSVESDSRSSYFVFAQMENLFGISNGGQNQKSSNYNGQNSKGAHISELQFSKEVQTECFNENGGEVEGVLQDDVAADVSWEVKEEEGDNHRLTEDGDPLAESILSLQAVQETLEREIQKFVDIGLDHVLLPDDFIPGHGLPVEFTSVDPEVYEPNSSGQMCFEEIKISGSPPLEAQFVELKQKVNLLESNLKESSAILKTKESGVVEVDAILNRGETLKGESGSSLKSLQEKCREMEIELEGLFKQKFEAEVEYLVITRTTQKFKIAAEDQVLLLDEQKSLAGEQNQLLQKLRDAESKAVLLKRQADKLDASCGELLGTEEVLKMQNRVCKFTLCFVVQFILLFVAFGMFLLHLLPHSTGFVPT